MDPLRLIARAVFAYVFILVLIRVSGKRTVKQGDLASFVVALILGDLFDDLFWAEVSASQFVVAAGTIVFLHLLSGVHLFAGHARTGRLGSETRAE